MSTGTRWCVLQEPLHDPDPSLDGVVAQVAAQLLVAPSVEHFLHGLRLDVQQRNRSHNIDATALIDGHNSLPAYLI